MPEATKSDDLKIELKNLADAQSELRKVAAAVKEAMQKANEEIDALKKLNPETKAELEKLSEQGIKLTDKCLELERKMHDVPEGPGNQPTIGEQFTKSEEWKTMCVRRSGSARIEIKTAIVNATGQNQPLVPSIRVPGIIANPNRVLTIRDLLPVGQTSSNLVEYTKENVFTNSAGPQYSSPNTENVSKAESGITFTLATAAVITLAHYIPVSRQVLDDSPMLQSYINGRLMYGLKLEEEKELLTGAGTGGKLSGLFKSGNYTAYSRAVTGDTKLDTLRRAKTQVALSDYFADAFILNPADLEDIELIKDDNGNYVWVNPAAGQGSAAWGTPIVATNSMTSGSFLTGSFSMSAQIWDRQDAAVQISLENSDNFVKNMATLLAEERLALAIYRTAGLVGGSF